MVIDVGGRAGDNDGALITKLKRRIRRPASNLSAGDK